MEGVKNLCLKTLFCGHNCGGVFNERDCLPCLKGCSTFEVIDQSAEDLCKICLTDRLDAFPAIQLKCGHVFHFSCVETTLQKRWSGARITFAFANCPICKVRIEHTMLSDLLVPIHSLYEEVSRKALTRLEYDRVPKSQLSTLVNLIKYAMEKYAYYICSKCSKAYFGGEAKCGTEPGFANDFDPRDLICGACSETSPAQVCHQHGSDYLGYKCRYCCSFAIFFCFGTTHFCTRCHDDYSRLTGMPIAALPRCPAGPGGVQLNGENCPLGISHPPAGEEFALGCGICCNANTF